LCKQASASRLKYSREFQGRFWWLASCRSCGLHFTDPPPTKDDVQSFYRGEYHSDLCVDGKDVKNFGPKFKRYIEFMRPYLPAGSTTLDVGCATGLLPKMLQNMGYLAEGIELNPATAQWGRDHYGIPIHQGTIETLYDSIKGRFDLVSITDVLEHTVDPVADLFTIRTILKEKGYLLVTFPDIRSFSSRYLGFVSRILRRDWLWSTCHIPFHTWEFTYPAAKRLFEENGFALVAFQRSQAFSLEPSMAGIVSLPSNVAAIPGLRKWIGKQMEFILRKC
jgi:SAM-dependent methyltransferase